MIRLARYDEAAACLAVMHRAFAETAAYPEPSSALREDLGRVQRAFAEGSPLLAFADAAFVGTGRVVCDPPLRRRLHAAAHGQRFAQVPGAVLTFERMGVVPEHRGAGHGRALTAWIEGLAKRVGAEAVEATARSQMPDNRPFYTALGFAITGYSGRYGIPGIRTHLRKSIAK